MGLSRVTSRIGLLVGGLAALGLAACEQRQPKDQYRFVEYTRVEGECFEDHVKRRAPYAGSIVHWHNTSKNTHSRYGSVHHVESLKALVAAGQDPYSYKPPFTVSFDDLREDEVAGSKLHLKGISEHLGKDENNPGPRYRATCDLRVLERLDHLPGKEPDSQGKDRG